MERLGTVDHGSVIDQFGDLLQNRQGHPVDCWQDQHPVAHPTGRYDASIFHLHEVEEHIGVADIVIESFGHGRREGTMADGSGNPLAVEITEVSPEDSLLEQVLATGDVVNPSRALIPPSVGPLEVDSPRPHAHPGLAVQPRLMGVAVEDKSIHTQAELLITQRLQRIGIVLPSSGLSDRGERFCRRDVLPVEMGGAGGLLRVINIFISGVIDPELAHRDIGKFFAEELIGHRRHADPSGLGSEAHAVLAGELLDLTVVVLGKQISQRAAVVPEKALGLLGRTDDRTGQDWQPRDEVITPAFSEFRWQLSRPVFTPAFPAIEQDILEGGADASGRVGYHGAEHVLDVMPHRHGAKLIAFQAGGCGGMRRGPRAGMADAQQGPVAGWHLPFPLPRQVDN